MTAATPAAVDEALAAFEASVRLFPGSDRPVFGYDELTRLLLAVRAHERAVIMTAGVGAVVGAARDLTSTKIALYTKLVDGHAFDRLVLSLSKVPR